MRLRGLVLSTFTVRELEPGDRSAVIALLRSMWGGTREGLATVDRLEEQWEWRFLRNPEGSSSVPRGFVLERDEKIVGHVSCTPMRVKIRNSVVPAFSPGEWVTDPARGRGYGPLLMRRVMALPGVGIAAPNEIAYPAMKRLGWSDVCRLESWVRIVRADRLLLSGIRRRLRRAAAPARGLETTGEPPRARVRADDGIEIVPVERFDERFDDLWDRVAPELGAAVVRDRRFLNWRYVDIPARRYAIAAAERRGELQGYAVYYARRRDDVVFGHVIDVLVAGADPSTRDALLAYAVGELKRSGVDVITSYTAPHDSFFRAGLRRVGFPLARRGPTVLAIDRVGGSPCAINPAEWFLTRGDSDLDMAT
jgi:hypothetical protein